MQQIKKKSDIREGKISSKEGKKNPCTGIGARNINGRKAE